MMNGKSLFSAAIAAGVVGFISFAACGATTASWIGGATDAKTSTLLNWDVGGETPTTLPLKDATLQATLTGGALLQYEDGDAFDSIANGIVIGDAPVSITPFVIEPATEGATLILANGLKSVNKRTQLVLKGHFALPPGVEGGEPTAQNAHEINYLASTLTEQTEGVITRAVSSQTAFTAPLVLAGATLDIPYYQAVNSAMNATLLAMENTTNVFNEAVNFACNQSWLHALQGSVVRFMKGFNSAPVQHFAGPGEFQFIDRPMTGENGFIFDNGVRGVIDSTGNYAGGNSGREGFVLSSSSILDCRCNNCFVETAQVGNSSTGQTNMVFELNATTQRIGRVFFSSSKSDSYFHGDPGSMLELTGQKREDAQKAVSTVQVAMQVKGALSIHCMSPDVVVEFFNSIAYESCGDLIVSAGTNYLYSGTSWLHGTNFVMKGTGVMRFGGMGQVNKNFATFHFADEGRVLLSANSTLEVWNALETDANGKVHQVPAGTYDATMTVGPLANRILGSGKLKVLCSHRERQPALVETTDDMTAAGDWEVLVDAGCSNVVTGVQTGAGKIIKKGEGFLVLKQENTFTGGVEIQGGHVVVDPVKPEPADHIVETTALGLGDVEICGQYGGPIMDCQLDIIGAGSNDTRIVTIANDIRVTGNTTKDYPALVVYGQNSVLKGKITAAQDFIFYEDFNSCTAIFPTLSNRYNNLTSLTFGEVDVAGTFGSEGYTKILCKGKIKASVLDTTIERPIKFTKLSATDANAHQAFELYAVNEIGRIITSKHPFYCKVENALGGAVIEWAYRALKPSNQVTTGNIDLTGLSQTVAGFASDEVTLEHANSSYDGQQSKGTDFIFGSTMNTQTVTIKGVPSESGTNLVACCLMGYWHSKNKDGLSLVLDSQYPNFTQTFRNRHSPMAGTITVKNGTFKIDGTATFSNVTAITVGPAGAFIDESTHAFSLMSAKTLSIAGRFEIAASAANALPSEFAELDFHDGCTISVPGWENVTTATLRLNGCQVPAGTWTHANCAAIPEGLTVTSTGGGWQPATVTQYWVGGGADDRMTTLANYKNAPESVDLSSGATAIKIQGGGQMLYGDGMLVNAVESQLKWTNATGGVVAPFVIGPADDGDALQIVNKINLNQVCQTILRGHIATPFDLPQTAADQALNFSAVKVDKTMKDAVTAAGCRLGKGDDTNGYSLPLLLDGVTIDKPFLFSVMANSSGSLVSLAGTTNLVNGLAKCSGSYQNYIMSEAGSLLDFQNGLTSPNSLRLSGGGVVKVSNRPYTNTAYTCVYDVRLVLDAEDCSVGGNQYGEGIMLQMNGSSVEFARSWALRDGLATLAITAYSGSEQRFEFNQTTQRVGRVGFMNTHSKSCLRDDYPAMLEITGHDRPGSLYFQKAGNEKYLDSLTMNVEGGLSVHLCSTNVDYVFTLSNRVFKSCGDLAVSGGTLALAAGATWLNGTNFTAKGEGTLKFAEAGQVNPDFAAVHFEDSGKIYIPEGVTLSFAEGDIGGNPITNGKYTGSEGVLKDRIIGGGTLRIGKRGMMLMIQ